MKLSNSNYDFLKKSCMVYLPALITFYGVVANTLQWSHVNEVITIATAFVTMLGTMLGISSRAYYDGMDDE